MTLHIVKLCVGCDSIEELAEWQSQRLGELARAGAAAELMHVTRQTPRRAGFDPGASASSSCIYWVMGGFIRSRQRIVELREIRGSDGIPRCGLVFDPALTPTEPQPRRPFQGWRYLPAGEAPRDLDLRTPVFEGAMPPQMRAALLELRLL
jgi:hypothetical protein